jgi:hypothetical protein
MSDGDPTVGDAGPDSGSEDPPATSAADGDPEEPFGADPDATAGPSSVPGGPHPNESTVDGPTTDPSSDAPPDTASGPPIDELTGTEHRLEPRVRYVWVLQALVSALVFGAVVGVPAVVFFGEPLLGPAVFSLFAVVGASLAYFRYRTWRYEVREDSLFLERGVFTHTRTVVPYVRIQHVDASRGPLERGFGLATTVVYTAGSRGADVSIPGLTPERADDLQDRLKRLAIAAEGEDAV